MKLLRHWFKAVKAVYAGDVTGPSPLGVHHADDGADVSVCRYGLQYVAGGAVLRYVPVQLRHYVDDAGRRARVGVNDADVRLHKHQSVHQV